MKRIVMVGRHRQRRGGQPLRRLGASGNGTSIGGPANWEEFTQWQWVTVKAEAPAYPL